MSLSCEHKTRFRAYVPLKKQACLIKKLKIGLLFNEHSIAQRNFLGKHIFYRNKVQTARPGVKCNASVIATPAYYYVLFLKSSLTDPADHAVPFIL